MSDVTQILNAIHRGDRKAADQLLPLVYDELRKLAAQKLRREAAGQSLQATALVHEAYLRLVDQEESQKWDSDRHFFSAAAEAMRRILIERARKKGRTRHGGGRRRVELDHADVADEPDQDVLAVDEALTRFAAEAPEKAELVKLRYFAGLTIPEAAKVLGVSRTTATRHWTYAKLWLYAELNEPDDETGTGNRDTENSRDP